MWQCKGEHEICGYVPKIWEPLFNLFYCSLFSLILLPFAESESWELDYKTPKAYNNLVTPIRYKALG